MAAGIYGMNVENVIFVRGLHSLAPLIPPFLSQQFSKYKPSFSLLFFIHWPSHLPSFFPAFLSICLSDVGYGIADFQAAPVDRSCHGEHSQQEKQQPRDIDPFGVKRQGPRTYLNTGTHGENVSEFFFQPTNQLNPIKSVKEFVLPAFDELLH